MRPHELMLLLAAGIDPRIGLKEKPFHSDKKCKSCASFTKGQNHPCDFPGRYIDGWSMACIHYKKRNK